MRIFVAVELPEEIHRGISELQLVLSRRGGAGTIRWVRSAGVHLTLRFCGEISPETVELLASELSTAAPVPPFPVRLRRVDFFPPKGRPRVVYLGVEPSDSLSRLAAWVDERAVRSGVRPETRGFRPHLTLGRFKEGAGGRIDWTPVEALPQSLQEDMPVDQFAMFRSHLQPAGPRYEVLHRFSLPAGEAL